MGHHEAVEHAALDLNDRVWVPLICLSTQQLLSQRHRLTWLRRHHGSDTAALRKEKLIILALLQDDWLGPHNGHLSCKVINKRVGSPAVQVINLHVDLYEPLSMVQRHLQLLIAFAHVTLGETLCISRNKTFVIVVKSLHLVSSGKAPRAYRLSVCITLLFLRHELVPIVALKRSEVVLI